MWSIRVGGGLDWEPSSPQPFRPTFLLIRERCINHLLKTRVDQASALGLTRCAAYRISVGGCCQSILVFLVQKDDQGKIEMQGFHNRKFQHHSHSI
jgi:hypothetical protein